MCQATVFVGYNKVAEEVIGLELVPGGVRLEAFFEDPTIVRGRIRSIDFLRHQVLLDPPDEETGDER